MIDGIEEAYEQIANSMIETIPEEWTAASFQAIFYPDGSVYEAEYIRKGDGKARGFQPAGGGSRAFRQLRKLFKDAGKPLWGSACLELKPDGKFNVKWNYEKCDPEGYAIFDADVELQRHEARRKRLAEA